MVDQGEWPGRDVLSETTDQASPAFETGDKICVRNRFLGDWSAGFEVADVLGHGYRIRRVSDGLAFPDVFPFEEVRRERRQDPERAVVGSRLDRYD